jgi:ABC-type nitrate/sulfonate/bicarbonate transport system permease component
MAPWLTDIRGQVPARWALVLGLLPVALLVAAWWWGTRGVPEERLIAVQILPAPGEVLAQVPELLTRRDSEGNHELLHHLGLSLRRVGLGFLIGAGLAVPLGVAMGAFGSVRALCSPLATASGYLPISTLVPLSMSWFGTDELQKVLFLALAFAIFLLPLAAKAVDQVPEVLLRTARTCGAGRWQLVRRVLVPVAAPDLWHALRISFGVGWTYIVLTEALVQSGGLGFLITMAQRRGPKENIYLVIILITVIAWLADRLLAWIGERLFPWRPAGRA